ncbi:hypothetical protein ACFV5G_23325 [Streptomyces sp. NPDC059766]|uniref:hypothetical protein n=1 Tax=Streptomyces sp. NPDC059766 TaxID=3346940 RepID=UPI003662E13B
MNRRGSRGSSTSARSVLAVGVPVRQQDEGGVPPLDALHPLDEAPHHAKSVARLLERFGYAPRPCADQDGEGEGDTDPGGAIRRAVTSREISVLIVHVVAHGRLAKQGERGLHVVGPDGMNLDDPVSAWISLIESHHHEKSRPLTLFILDLCHSGAAAVLPWHQEMRADDRRAWVIAASGREDKAYDYRLSRATATVLKQYLDGTLRVDPSLRHIPLPTVGNEISRVVTELGKGAGGPQRIEVSRAPFTALRDLDSLPFFPNPGYDRPHSVLSEVDPDFASLLDEAFDPRHFMLRGAGAEALNRGVGRGYFRGRETELRTLSDWFNGVGPGFRIVTGRPGSGKSALLGVLVCAAHHVLRDRTERLWFPLPVKPGLKGPDQLAVVHARRRDLVQIADSIARQWGATDADRPAGGWDAESLTRLARADSTDAAPGFGRTLVLDALDEAERPEDITQALLLPLARAAMTGDWGPRLLVATRPEPRFAPLLRPAGNAASLVDLDDTRPADTYEALRRYIADLLAVDTPYSAWDAATAADALAEGIAARLTGVNDPTGEDSRTPDGRKPLGWGEFLVAGLYLNRVLTQPVEHDPARARALGLDVPRDQPRLLEQDLTPRTTHPPQHPPLAAHAPPERHGNPERVIAHVAAAFTPPGPGEGTEPEGSPLPIAVLHRALSQARFYLRRDIDTDGTTLYRLFHEGLAEHLRADPYGAPEQEQS